MISKTQIFKRTEKKTNPEIVETIELAKKNNLLDLAKKLSSPKRNYTAINLDELGEIGDSILVVGKVLGNGNIKRKIKVSALFYSRSALEKLKKADCEVNTIKQELENNPKLKDVNII